MQTKTIKGKTTGEIKTALNESMAKGFKPTLGIVFLSVKQDIIAVTKILDQKGIQVFGATTAGEFIDGEMEAGSIVMMLLDINPAYFKIELLETSQDSAFDDAIKLGITGKETFTKPAFIIVNSGVSLDGEPFVEGITEAFGKSSSPIENEVTVFGGKAADDLALEATFR